MNYNSTSGRSRFATFNFFCLENQVRWSKHTFIVPFIWCTCKN